MSKYFHAFRIDHILGFFRIWELPDHVIGGLLGNFYPAVPVTRDELSTLGFWDVDRLAEPYIKWHHLTTFFGATPDLVIQKFFDEPTQGNFKFKAYVNTENKIDDALKEYSGDQTDFRNKLFALLRNVILLRDDTDPDNLFHPRIELFKTMSYNELSGQEKQVLYDLYVDYFYNRQDILWEKKAYQKLPVMQRATDMLVCGEDLGMIPACVQGVLDNLHILGLRIQRMPKEVKNVFDLTESYSYLTVATPSVHDTSTLRGWWEEDRKATQQFFTKVLKLDGYAPYYCEPWVVEMIIQQHLRSKSMITTFAIQDLFALLHELRIANPKDERINIPAVRHHNWNYRIQLNIEDLLSHTDFAAAIAHIVTNSGR